MSASVENEQSTKRKPPMWPWILLLVLTLAGIYAHQQILLMIEDLEHAARDIAQLTMWLLSVVAD